MSDGFGLDRSARLAAQRELDELDARLPIELNVALPGERVGFDWRYFRVEGTSVEPSE